MPSINLLVFTICYIAFGQARSFASDANSVEEVVYLPIRVHRASYNPMERLTVDEDGYEAMPQVRVRRQTVFGGITPGNPGVTGTIGAKGNIFNQNGHSLDASGQISRTYRPVGPTAVGAGLDYQGPRGGASVNANHARGFGTDVGASANANLWRSHNGRSSLDANANYGRHFGGPFGTGRPNYGVGATFNHRF